MRGNNYIPITGIIFLWLKTSSSDTKYLPVTGDILSCEINTKFLSGGELLQDISMMTKLKLLILLIKITCLTMLTLVDHVSFYRHTDWMSILRWLIKSWNKFKVGTELCQALLKFTGCPTKHDPHDLHNFSGYKHARKLGNNLSSSGLQKLFFIIFGSQDFSKLKWGIKSQNV